MKLKQRIERGFEFNEPQQNAATFMTGINMYAMLFSQHSFVWWHYVVGLLFWPIVVFLINFFELRP